MWVIAGTLRSRQLIAPRGSETRPTSDRLRETLFNILAPRVAGCRFADLYAGTGRWESRRSAVAQSTCGSRSGQSLALVAIRANLEALQIERGFTVEERGTGTLLERLAKSAESAKTGELLNLAHLDPPWEAEARV